MQSMTEAEFKKFCSQLNFKNNYPKYKVTKTMKKNGYPIPKLGKLLSLTTENNNWTKLEKFMKINGKLINDEFCNISGTKAPITQYFVNGIVLERKGSGIVCTTTTCAKRNDREDFDLYQVSHQSIHTNVEFGLVTGYVNNFTEVDHFGFFGDGADYINEALDEFIKMAEKEKLKFFDVVK